MALSLPEDDEHQIKDKVFDQIPLDDLKSDFELSILIEFLDIKHLAKDDLADSLEKFDNFDDFKRKEGQSIHDIDVKNRKEKHVTTTWNSGI